MAKKGGDKAKKELAKAIKGLAKASLDQWLKEIQLDMDSNRHGDARSKIEEMLVKFPSSVKAHVRGAEFLTFLNIDDDDQKLVGALKQQTLDACVKSFDLIFAEYKKPTIIDKDCLNRLADTCKVLNRWDIIASCYASVCASLPDDVETILSMDQDVLEKAFEYNVHEYQLNEQKQIAFKMYNKCTKDQRQIFWVICSLQLEAFGSKTPAKSLEMALEVYEMFILDEYASKDVINPELLLVVISIMEQCQKYEQAIGLVSILSSNKLITQPYALSMEGRFLASEKKYPEAAKVFQKQLTECPNDWNCFLQYLSCVLEDDSMWSSGTNIFQIHTPKFGDSKLSLSDVKFDLCMATASAFVQSLVQANIDGNIRCLSLALLEIERRKLLQGKSDGQTLMKALLEYFISFGHFTCCILDAESSLQLLPTENIQVLVECFNPVFVPGEGVPSLAKQINCFKLQEYLDLSLNELVKNAVTMASLFIQSLPLSGNLEIQDSMHGEDLLSLACNALVQLFWRTEDVGYLLEAILILEFGLTLRRCNPEYKILLVHLYSHLGAFMLAYDRYTSLGIEKNLLLETVSHHIVPNMLSSPFLNYSTTLLDEYTAFIEHYFVMSADNAIYAYKWLNYSSIFGDFLLRDRLQNSQNYLMARIETPILQLKLKSDNIFEAEKFLESVDDGVQLLKLASKKRLKAVTINDDVQTRPWWSPTPEINYLLDPFKKISMSQDKNQLWLREQSAKLRVIKRKSMLLQLISFSIKSPSWFLDQDAGSSTQSNTLSSFSTLLVEYATNLGISVTEAESLVHGSSSLQEVEVSSSAEWLCLAVFCNANRLVTHTSDLLPNYWSELDNQFRNFTEKGIAPGHRLLNAAPGFLLCLFVQLVTEPLTWQCLVLESCARLLVSLRKMGKKKGTSERLTPAKQKKRQRAKQLNEAVLSSIVSLCATVEMIIEKFTIFSLVVNTCWTEGGPGFSPVINIERSEGSPVAPGTVLAVLRNFSSLNLDDEYGDRIGCALQSWDAGEVQTAVTESLKTTRSKFFSLCKSKVGLLKRLQKDLKDLKFV